MLTSRSAINSIASAISREVDIARIQNNPFAMRIEDPAISELSQSLEQIGMLSPIKLRPHPTDGQTFQLIFGHRRLLAAKQLGWKSVVATIMETSDEQMLVFALAENLERVNYSDYEQAILLKRLRDEFGKTIDEIAYLVGKSQSYVSLHISMLSLFDGVKANESDVIDVLKRLTERQARIISRLPAPDHRLGFAKLVLLEKLGLSEMEKLVGAPIDSYHQSKMKFNWRTKRYEDEEKITQIISDILEGLQNKDLRPYLRSRLPAEFLMFDDFDSAKLLDYDHAADSAAVYLKHAQHIELQLDSLRIIFSGKSAVAIFFVNQKLMSGGKWYVLRSRATVALLRKRTSWYIFHEHWSLVGDERGGLPDPFA